MSDRRRPNPTNGTVWASWKRKAGGYAKFIMALMMLRAPAHYRLVLLGLVNRVRPQGGYGTFPSAERLAADCGLDRKTVFSAIRYWEGRGVLSRKLDRKTMDSNEYTLGKYPLEVVPPTVRTPRTADGTTPRTVHGTLSPKGEVRKSISTTHTKKARAENQARPTRIGPDAAFDNVPAAQEAWEAARSVWIESGGRDSDLPAWTDVTEADQQKLASEAQRVGPDVFYDTLEATVRYWEDARKRAKLSEDLPHVGTFTGAFGRLSSLDWEAARTVERAKEEDCALEQACANGRDDLGVSWMMLTD